MLLAEDKLQQTLLCRMHDATALGQIGNGMYCCSVKLNTMLLHDEGQASPEVQGIDADVQGDYGAGKRHRGFSLACAGGNKGQAHQLHAILQDVL